MATFLVGRIFQSFRLPVYAFYFLSTVFEWFCMPAFTLASIICGLFTSILRFLNTVRANIMQYLSYYCTSFSRYLEDGGVWMSRIFNFVVSFLPFTVWWIRVCVWLIERLGEVSKEFIIALAKSVNSLLIFLILTLLWYTIFYPLLIGAENPGLFSELISLFVEFGKDVFNFFGTLWNIFTYLVNPFLPWLWSFTTYIVQTISLYYSAILHIAGLNPTFTTSFSTSLEKIAQVGQNFGNIGRDLATKGTQIGIVLKPANPVWKPAKNLIFPTSTQADEYADVVIKTGFALLELYYTIVFLVQEVAVKLFALLFKRIIDMIISIIGAVTCAPPAPLCYTQEFFAIFFRPFIDLFNEIASFFGLPKTKGLICSSQDLLKEAQGKDTIIPCDCGPGGLNVFTNPILSSSCQETYICKQTTNTQGEIIWSETKEQSGQVTSSSKNQRLGCPHKFGTQTQNSLADSRRKLGKISVIPNYRCSTTCILKEHSAHGWLFKVCGNQQIYLGQCNANKEEPIDIIPKRRLQEYIDWIPHEKTNIKNPLQGKQKFNAPETTDTFITMESVMKAINSIEHTNIDDKKLGMECSSIDYSVFTFEHFLFRMICIGKKIYYTIQEQKTLEEIHNTKRKLKNEDVYILDESLWDPIERVGWDEDDTPKMPESPNFIVSLKDFFSSMITDQYSMINTYGKAFAELKTILRNDSSYHHEKINQFHDAILIAHKDYITEGNPDRKTFAGIYKNIFTNIYTNVSSVYYNSEHSHHRLFYQGFKTKLFDDHTRRSLTAVNPQLAGVFGLNGGICGNINERLCPNLYQCEVDQTLCKWPESFTFASTIALVPYYSSTFLKQINVRLIFNNVVDCWKYILENPSANPAIAYSNGVFSTIDDDFKIPDSVQFCFPLIPPLPPIPYLAWNFKVWLTQTCGEQFVNSNENQICTCNQYTVGGSTIDHTSQWIYGVDVATKARLFRGWKAIQYIITRTTPIFLSNIWYTFVTSIFCASDNCPEIANAFNPIYASAGLSEQGNWMCLFLNMASLYYTLVFLYLVSTIFIHWYQFLFAIMKIAIEPLLVIIFTSMSYINSLDFIDIDVNEENVEIELERNRVQRYLHWTKRQMEKLKRIMYRNMQPAEDVENGHIN